MMIAVNETDGTSPLLEPALTRHLVLAPWAPLCRYQSRRPRQSRM